jgi:cell division transport system permease protein
LTNQKKVFPGFLLRLIYHVNETRAAFVWAFLTIGLSLFVLTFILVLLFHFRQVVTEVHQRTIATAFLSVSDKKEASLLEEQVKKLSTQVITKLISPEELLQKAQKNWNEKLDTAFLGHDLKMPWALIVSSKNDDPNFSELIKKRLKNFVQVEDLVTPGVELKRAQWSLRFFYSVGWLFAFLLAILVVAVVMNTIRIHVLKHMEEIRVMRLVGATEVFVSSPYVAEGFLLGFSGAILGFVLVGIFNFCCVHFVETAFLGDLQGLGFYDTPIWIFILVLIFGSALGALGAFLILLHGYQSEWRYS